MNTLQRLKVRAIASKLRILYFCFYFGMGSLLPYLSPYFASRGVSPAGIGLLLSISPLIGMVVPPLWGMLADRSRRTLPWVRIQFVMLPILVFTLFHTQGLLLLALALVALACFITAVAPLIDHIAMGYVQAEGLDYGRIRVFGSLGFSLANLSMSAFLLHQPLTHLYWLYIPALLGALLITAFMREHSDSELPPTNARDSQPTPALSSGSPLTSAPYSALRAFMPLAGFYAMLLCFSVTVPVYGSYFPLYIQDMHLPASLTSIAFALSSGSEVLTMPFATKLYARRGPRFMLTCSALAYVTRWLVLGLAHNAMLIVGAQVLHGVAFGFFYTSAVMYLRSAVPRDRLATGQTLFAATSALGNVIGNLGGGALFGLVGPRSFFELEALIALICVVIVRRALRSAVTVN